MMVALEKLGYGGSEIEQLSIVRVHQQVLFLSDVLCAGGRYIGKKYLKQRPLDERWDADAVAAYIAVLHSHKHH